MRRSRTRVGSSLNPEWHHGYPQPKEDDDGYVEATYDVAEHCERCRVGKRQKAPFQMKREPGWGRKGILQMNWILDEYFTTPEVWARVFEPYGVACRPVLNTKKVELSTVVQLVVTAEVDIVTDGLATEYTTCRECGRRKYLAVTRGRFPPLVEPPSTGAVKTAQYFGSGGSAWKAILVSQDIARALKGAKVRGASFRPVEGT